MQPERHVLHQGYLCDIPGRSESWTESVRYRGRGTWELVSQGTDFGGSDRGEVFKEKLSTKRMMQWVLERDAEEADSEPSQSGEEEERGEDEARNALGPRASRLLEIAAIVGAEYCHRCLLGYADGTWPPKPKAPTITQITGVALRPVWIRVSHAVFTVTTSAGPAFLYPPDQSGLARLVLKSASSMNQGCAVRLTRKWMRELEPWRDEMARLSRRDGVDTQHGPR